VADVGAQAGKKTAFPHRRPHQAGHGGRQGQGVPGAHHCRVHIIHRLAVEKNGLYPAFQIFRAQATITAKDGSDTAASRGFNQETLLEKTKEPRQVSLMQTQGKNGGGILDHPVRHRQDSYNSKVPPPTIIKKKVRPSKGKGVGSGAGPTSD
jgi:hypothetical protein